MPQRSEAEKIIAVHKGALGDFLQIWPSLYALKKNFPNQKIYWAGKSSYRIWTNPVGLKDCPWNLQKDLDRLYLTKTWPEELNDFQVFWFGLDKKTVDQPFQRLFFLKGIESSKLSPPREVYLEKLKNLGLKLDYSWPEAWKRLFAFEPHPGSKKNQVLIFPGSGHVKKCWPLDNFLQLAEFIKESGYIPKFVLGPVEQEQGLRIQKFEQILCADLEDLQRLILESRLTIGNDSGPMHLAGYLGVPCLALFGPTSAKQWGPYKAEALQSRADCSPCTSLARIDCKNPVCMQMLKPELVIKKTKEILTQGQD